MLITKLELHKYKRLSLNNIETLTLTPEEKVQLILGTNGSGKSSSIAKLIPEPANTKEFDSGGYWLLEGNHLNNSYLLKSSFAGKAFHSFIKNDNELNPGGTASSFKDLCWQEFRINSDIKDMLIGIFSFSKSSIAERRYWFTLLSDTNYDYALNTYQKMKDRLRDIQGGIKLTQNRLVLESNKLISSEEEILLTNEINDLSLIVNQLYTNINSNLKTQLSIENKDKEINSLLNNLTTLLNKSLYNIYFYENKYYSLIKEKYYNIPNNEDYNTTLTNLKFDNVRLQTLIQQNCVEVSKYQDTINKLNDANITNTQNLDIKILDIENQADELTSIREFNFHYENIQEAYTTLNAVYDSLTTIFSLVPNNSNNEYNKDNFIKLTESLNLLKNENSRIDKDLDNLISLIKEQETYKNKASVECPKCNYNWKISFNENLYNGALIKREQLVNKLNTNNNKIKELQDKLDLFKEYSNQLTQYTAIVNNTRQLNSVWLYIQDNNLFKNNANECINLLTRVKYDFDILFKIDKLKKEKQDLIKIKELQNSNENININNLELQLKELENLILEYQRQVSTNNEFIKLIDIIINEKKKSLNYKNDIDNLLIQLENNNDDLLKTIRQQYISKLITQLEVELKSKTAKLNDANYNRKTVNEIEKQLEDLNKRANALVILTKTLSPTEGLIAKGLINFINTFISQMNSFIAKIWTYPFEIQPCLINEEDGLDLDYKFSVKVNNEDNADDISKCSSAMREVIDLAFKIVSMKYLGLMTFPMILDEFGRSFDPEHRRISYDIINKLIANADFSQIYIVSHNQECHGSLSNCDINVICGNNISIKDEYNKTCIIR